MAKNECPTIILDDLPTDHDEFSGDGRIGPHSRVANSIADIICSSQIGGKMIGIEGGWGSGKTNVIVFLKQLLESDKNITTFVFDAWAHRDDPLRRTFLESIIYHLKDDSNGWLSSSQWKSKWKNKIDHLSNRRREWTKTTIPKTTPLGTWFAITATLVPLGAALVAGSVSRGITLYPTMNIMWDFIAGLILSISPLLVASFYCVYERLNGRKPRWALLSGKATVERTTQETELPDPTSREFEQIFDELMEDILENNVGRKIVLVLDNLDRVEPQDALSIWSTLQTFLQFSGRPERKWLNRLWVVVPYDSSGLKSLWNERNREIEKNQNDKNIDKNDSTKNENVKPRNDKKIISPVNQNVPSVADSFIDKSFQIRFELPTPVRSNWRYYLKKLIIKALPEHKDDVDEICRVYSISNPNYNPTPRELKLFVNQIGMVHRQWSDHTFPLSHIAYYVLLRRKNFFVEDAVIEPPDPSISQLVTNKPHSLQDSLAGLAFNVEPRLGMQIFLMDRVFKSLTSGKSEEVDDLASKFPEGFWDVLDDTSNMIIQDADPIQLEEIIRCSVKSKTLLADEQKSKAKILFECLSKRAANTDIIWPSFNKETGESIGKLARIINNPDSTSNLAESIRRTGAKREDGISSLNDDLLEGIYYFIKNVREIGHLKSLEEPFPVSGDAKQWLDCIPKLKELNDEDDNVPFLSHLLPGAKPEEIVSLISSVVENSSANPEYCTAVTITHKSALDIDWNSLVVSCRKWFENTKDDGGTAKGYALEILLRLKDDGGIEKLKELVDKQIIYHALNHDKTNKRISAVVRFLSTIMMVDRKIKKPGKSATPQIKGGYQKLIQFLESDNEDNKEKATELVRFILETLEPRILFDTIMSRKKIDPLFSRAISIIANDEKHCVKIPTDFIITFWPDIKNEVNIDDKNRFDRLIDILVNRGSIVDDLLSNDFNIEQAELYSYIIDNSVPSKFIEWCNYNIIKVAENEWIKMLKGENKLLDLVIALNKTKIPLQLPHSYRDALVKFAEGVMQGQTNVSDRLKAKDIDSFELLGDENNKYDFRVRCARDMIDQGGEIDPIFFELFGEHMLTPEHFSRNDQCVSELFQGLVINNNAAGLKWLLSLLKKDSRLIDSASSEIANVFRSRLRECLETQNDQEIISILIEIAKILNVDIPESGSDDEQNTDDSNDDNDNNHDEGNNNKN